MRIGADGLVSHRGLGMSMSWTVRGQERQAGNKSGVIAVRFCYGGWTMSVFCQAVVYLLVALPAVAQSQAFATITIKPARSADPRNRACKCCLTVT